MSDAAESLKAFVLGIVRPLLLGRTSYEYIVKAVAESDGRMDLVPAHSRVAPKLKGVPQWPGIAGGRSRPVLNTSVEVRFLDGDPAKPIVGSYVPMSSQLGRPLRVELDISDDETARLILAHGTQPVARVDDTVACGSLQITPGGGGLLVTYTSPSEGAVTWTITGSNGSGPVTFLVLGGPSKEITGIITSGREEVLA